MTDTSGAYVQDITRLSATDLAARIASGELRAQDAVDAFVARIESVNPALNAVVVERFDQARDEARDADRRRAAGEPLGPLHGVPITVKECLDLAGTPSTFGLVARAKTIAPHDDPYVARLRAAGAIVLGKTNVAQLLLSTECYNPVYGRTNNPWDHERTPGGSSGGEAAVIAAGGSPLGLGTDIGGSSRVPAAFCGIAGFKPTQGRTPDSGRASVPVGQRAIVSQTGVLARCTGDLALALRLIDGAGDDPLEARVPLGDHRERDVAAMRIAYYEDDGLFEPSPAVRRAVREAVAHLASAGAEVVAWTPPSLAHAAELFFGLLSADRGRGMLRLLRGEKTDPNIAPLLMVASKPRAAVSALRALLGTVGQRRTAAMMAPYGYGDTDHYWQLAEAQIDYRRRFVDALDCAPGGPFDAIVTPPCALPAYTHGAARDLGLPGTYSLLPNVLGFPAGVVPVTRVRDDEAGTRRDSRDVVEKAAARVDRDSGGLPVGVQVIARPWRDDVALAVMRAIELATASTSPSTFLAPGRDRSC
jgi:fatty acid amide hydrolase